MASSLGFGFYGSGGLDGLGARKDKNQKAALDFVLELAGPRTVLPLPTGVKPLCADSFVCAEELPVPMFAVDRNLNCVLWNRRAVDISGWTEPEVLALKRFSSSLFLFHPSSHQRDFASILRGAIDGRDFAGAPFYLRTKSGRPLEVLLFASTRTDLVGAVSGAVCVLIPVEPSQGCRPTALKRLSTGTTLHDSEEDANSDDRDSMSLSDMDTPPTTEPTTPTERAGKRPQDRSAPRPVPRCGGAERAGQGGSSNSLSSSAFSPGAFVDPMELPNGHSNGHSNGNGDNTHHEQQHRHHHPPVPWMMSSHGSWTSGGGGSSSSSDGMGGMMMLRGREGGTMRALIIEDNAKNRSSLASVLERCGFEVECANNIREGLWRFESAQSSPSRSFELVFVELSLAAEDGYAPVKELRQMERRLQPAEPGGAEVASESDAWRPQWLGPAAPAHGGVKILAVTRMNRWDLAGMDNSMDNGLKAGIDAFIPQPDRVQQLQDTLRKLGVRSLLLDAPASLPRALSGYLHNPLNLSR